MKRFYRFSALLCALALTCPLAACGGSAPASASLSEPAVSQPVQQRPFVETADPQAAIDEIYAQVEIKGLSDADEEDLEDLFSFDMDTVDEFYVRYASGRYGVADVFIIKPAGQDEQSMRQMLERLLQVQLARVAEFENYDIYNSYQIAQEAQVFERGGYAVLLMLEDAERAREIVNHYLPE